MKPSQDKSGQNRKIKLSAMKKRLFCTSIQHQTFFCLFFSFCMFSSSRRQMCERQSKSLLFLHTPIATQFQLEGNGVVHSCMGSIRHTWLPNHQGFINTLLTHIPGTALKFRQTSQGLYCIFFSCFLVVFRLYGVAVRQKM